MPSSRGREKRGSGGNKEERDENKEGGEKWGGEEMEGEGRRRERRWTERKKDEGMQVIISHFKQRVLLLFLLTLCFK